MLGSLILYLRGMRLMMFQLSGSCSKCTTRRILVGKTAARTGVYEDVIRVHQAKVRASRTSRASAGDLGVSENRGP